jgi:alpha,alpha-trehalose phosphorylase
MEALIVIPQPAFTVEPWRIRETRLHLDLLGQTESVFALSNGHIGLRGTFDEGEPFGLMGTYLNSVYELHPFLSAELAYGSPESRQTIINVTDGKLIRLLVDDEPFDVRYGTVEHHERDLDFRDGVLRRHVRWTSPAGRTITVTSTRLVSFTQRAIMAIAYEIVPLDDPVRIVLQSELVANEAPPDLSHDPRAGSVLNSPLESEEHLANGMTGLLIHHTHTSFLRVGAAMDHEVAGPDSTMITSESSPDVARVSVAARLMPGETLRLVKFVAYGWSSQRSRPAIHDQVIAALAAARSTGWQGLLAEQRAFLDDFWAQADVAVDGDPAIQQAVRYALFQVLQASARGERRPIPAKGLTGPGYEGHAFWDTEIFVLPVLTLTQSHAACDALRWRHSILPQARDRARQLGLSGAAFPWRTIGGEECSGYWPASTAAFHINADIAYAVTSYLAATADAAFEAEAGLEILVETARLWRSLSHIDAAGRFRIDGVTGPDEYSALADNNVYTNLMAQHNLRSAAESVQRHTQAAQSLGVSVEEVAAWRDIADRMYIPFNPRLGVTPQDETFTEHDVWNFAGTAPEQYPLFLHFPYFDLYRKQVIKQADLVLAMHLCCEAFTPEQKARNFAYYEPLTVRDSSLSAATQAVLAAEIGQVDLAYEYLEETALLDLDDREHNTRDGLHLAALAGTWTALVAGFGGLRIHRNELAFAPRLPAGINQLTFHLRFRDRRLRVAMRATEATYRLLDGKPIAVWHHGSVINLSVGEDVIRAIPPLAAGPRPTQPQGRKPFSRRANSSS